MISDLKHTIFTNFILEFGHHLDIVENDVLSEQNFDFLEVKRPIEKHVPTDRGSCSEDHTQPFSDFRFELLNCKARFFIDSEVIDSESDFNFPFVTKRHDFWEDAIVAVGSFLVFFVEQFHQHVLHRSIFLFSHFGLSFDEFAMLLGFYEFAKQKFVGVRNFLDVAGENVHQFPHFSLLLLLNSTGIRSLLIFFFFMFL